MRNMSRPRLRDALTDAGEVVDGLPTASELRSSLRSSDDGRPAEPVDRLVRALESAERRGRTAFLVAVEPRGRATSAEPLIMSMLPEDPPDVPSRAAVLQARRNAEARMELLREFGYLTAEQVADGRSRAANRSALAGRWRAEGKIAAVEWKGRVLYPAFQFDEQGAPFPAVASVLAVLPRDRMSDWEVALWWTAANGWLAGDRPVDRLTGDDAGPLVVAARQLAEPSPL
jgi:hypothetical protein